MISNNESRQLVNELVGTKKAAAAEVIPLMAELPIDQLPSGNFQLTIEVRSRENLLLAFKQCFFQRINTTPRMVRAEDIALVDPNGTFISSIQTVDSLKECIACMYPILSPLEGEIAERRLQIGDQREMQQFLYYYWSKKNATDPQKAWSDYHLEVLKVNAAYSTKNR
ncbi:MAG: hypothetical protein ACKO7B_02510, partial [Flavobacteriales bacterium]